MFEVWTRLQRFAMYAPRAYFNSEADADDYAAYLKSRGIAAEVHYNETAVFADYDAPDEWAHANAC